MKRLKVILALALALGIMVTISVAPALANNNKNNNDNRLERKDLKLDRKILHELRDDNNFGCCDNDFRFGHNNDCCDDDIDFVGFNTFGFNNFNCGHWEWHWVFDRWEWEDDCD